MAASRKRAITRSYPGGILWLVNTNGLPPDTDTTCHAWDPPMPTGLDAGVADADENPLSRALGVPVKVHVGVAGVSSKSWIARIVVTVCAWAAAPEINIPRTAIPIVMAALVMVSSPVIVRNDYGCFAFLGGMAATFTHVLKGATQAMVIQRL
jgi:hypothetical protein